MCMHTRATAPCSTQKDNIVLKQIKIDMPCYRVTGEGTKPIDPTVASYVLLYTLHQNPAASMLVKHSGNVQEQ